MQNKRNATVKIISIVGEKNSGKTSVISQLIPRLLRYGRVGCIKHAEHLDVPHDGKRRSMKIVMGSDSNKDTERMLSAGADVVVGITEDMMMCMRKLKQNDEVTEATLITEKIRMQRTEDMLERSLDVMRCECVDFVIIEGFKRSKIPKIVISKDNSGIYENVVMHLPPSHFEEKDENNSAIDEEKLENIISLILSIPDW